MSQHHTPARRPDRPGPATTLARQPRVVLVGNPNVGKSTLFNLLTGGRQKTMNAPRTTVSFEIGRWTIPGSDGTRQGVELLDLPGTYSLIALSPDEEVSANAVGGGGTGPLGRRPDLAVVVLDAGALASSLYLLAQVALTGLSVIGALTMTDVAAARGVDIDAGRLADELGVPIVTLNPRLGRGAEALADAVAAALVTGARPTGLPGPSTDSASQSETDPPEECIDFEAWADTLFDWALDIVRAAGVTEAPRATRSDRIDRVLLNPWTGIPLFLAILWAVFELTTLLAAPLQDAFESFITGPVASGLVALLGLPGWDGTWVESLLVDGVLAGVGVVVSFLPLMAIMFAGIALLEDSGYMSRVALLADRLMRSIGLDGRAVLPLVIGFGCNLPALAATKTIPNARQRLLTGLLVPFSSCTARLVVYLFTASIFFPSQAGTVVFAMYVVSILVIVGVGLILRRTVWRRTGREALVMVLPTYQTPRAWPLVRSVATRCRSFLLRAGQVIVSLSIVVWLLMWTPVTSGYGFAAEIPAADSLFGAVSEAISPVFAPAGFDDWHASAALVTGFVAKESVVGTLATTYGIAEPDDPTAPDAGLAAAFRASLETSSGGHGAAAALAFMVFILAYTPCMAAVGEQRRLFGGKVALASVGSSVVLAWVLAVGVFQIARLIA